MLGATWHEEGAEFRDAAVDGIARRLRGSDVGLLVVLWRYLDV